jgi:hypothetical protein
MGYSRVPPHCRQPSLQLELGYNRLKCVLPVAGYLYLRWGTAVASAVAEGCGWFHATDTVFASEAQFMKQRLFP